MEDYYQFIFLGMKKIIKWFKKLRQKKYSQQELLNIANSLTSIPVGVSPKIVGGEKREGLLWFLYNLKDIEKKTHK